VGDKTFTMRTPRAIRTALLLFLSACGADPFAKALPDSYVLLVPAANGTTRQVDLKESQVQPLPRLLESGFLSEMLRTAYLSSQLIREGKVDGHGFPAQAIAQAKYPVVFLVGADKAQGKGITLEGGLFSSPKSFPDVPWIGLPSDLGSDKALIQTVAGRIAQYVATQVALVNGSPMSPPAATMVDGYRIAMEVIAREWRFGNGPAGVIQFDEGTKEQREIFANVRENYYVFREGERQLKSPAELLSSPGVMAAIVYRMAQSKGVGPKVAPFDFYAPFAKDRMPPGVNPAAILGPFRNFQAKFLSAWAAQSLRATPRDILDLVAAYGAAFPAERHEAIRIAVVTTFGACAKDGGVSTDPKASTTALAELTAISAEIVAGKRSIRQVLEPVAPKP